MISLALKPAANPKPEPRPGKTRTSAVRTSSMYNNQSQLLYAIDQLMFIFQRYILYMNICTD
jgi:hypothetical protein